MPTINWLKSVRSLAAVLAATLLIGLSSWLCAAVAGQPPATTKSAPKDLIGLETNGPFYPDGWQQIASTGFGRSPYILTTLRRGKQHVMLLERQTNEPKKGERIRAVVTDVIEVANAISYHQLARLCYFPGQESDKVTSNILAQVGFAKYCDMKTTLIRKAWKINLQTGKFDVVPSTKGMVCEFGYISLGEPDFREGCPTFNWR